MGAMLDGLVRLVTALTPVQIGFVMALGILFWFLLPSAKSLVNTKIKTLGKREDANVDSGTKLTDFLMKRTETLEKERETSMYRILTENAELRDRQEEQARDMKVLREQNEMLWRRITSLEWILMTEICTDLTVRISNAKNDIATRLVGIRDFDDDPSIADLAIKVEIEFNTLLDDLKQTFLLRQLERVASESTLGRSESADVITKHRLDEHDSKR